MEELKGFQNKYLRGLAHSLKPVVIIGQHGLTETVIASIDEALDSHELIKIKFNEFKEKDLKAELTEEIKKRTLCQSPGMIGHMVILYRQQKVTEKRKIKLPMK